MDREVGSLTLIVQDSRWTAIVQKPNGETALPDDTFADFMKRKCLGVVLTKEEKYEYILFEDGNFWLTGNIRYVHV